MKKLILLFSLATILFSCKSYTNYTNQEVLLVENKTQKFTLDNNEILIDVKINNKKGVFLLDTGAMSSVITDSDYINSFNLTKDNYYTSIKMKGATGNTIESKEFIADFTESEIIKGKKKLFKHLLISDSKIKKCNSKKTSNKVGIIGFDVFKNAAQPILLDFDNQNIKVLNPDYLTDGFQKLKTTIPTLSNEITIPFIIDGEKMDFLFDTGNSGGLLISNKDCNISNEKIFLECETIVGTAGKTSNERIKVYQDVIIKMDNVLNETTNVTSLPKLTKNTLGIAFIKHFNWILDFKTGAIYYKKIADFNNNEQNKEANKLPLKCGVMDNNLIIGYKNLSIKTSFNIYDQITSVNQEKVTPENICEMQDLLNKTEDWNTLNLEVIPATK